VVIFGRLACVPHLLVNCRSLVMDTTSGSLPDHSGVFLQILRQHGLAYQVDRREMHD
jgi:hypothetical protein